MFTKEHLGFYFAKVHVSHWEIVCHWLAPYHDDIHRNNVANKWCWAGKLIKSIYYYIDKHLYIILISHQSFKSEECIFYIFIENTTNSISSNLILMRFLINLLSSHFFNFFFDLQSSLRHQETTVTIFPNGNNNLGVEAEKWKFQEIN